jgi:hypothetical protein
MLGVEDPTKNDVFLAAVVPYLEQLSSWEDRFGTWQRRSEADRLAYATFFGLEAPKKGGMRGVARSATRNNGR